MVQQTGCDLVMVGRASLGNPFLFAEIKAALNTEGGRQNSEVPPVSWPERMEVVKEHIKMSMNDKGELRGIREMRKHLGWYLQHMGLGEDPTRAARASLLAATTASEQLGRLRAILSGITSEAA
jgi:tRNA-dihydrouridine synthase B